MYGDDKYMFCAVRVNDLFMVNSGWRELDWIFARGILSVAW